MTGRPLLADAIRTGRRLHLVKVSVALFLLLLALTPLARTASLGRAERAAIDLLLGGQWMVVCAMAVALGVHVASPNAVDSLLSARGLPPTSMWSWRLAGAAVLHLGIVAVAAIVALVAAGIGWIPLSPGLAVWALWLALEGLVVLTMASALRRLLTPAGAWSLALVLWLLGHLADETVALAAGGHTSLPWLYAILPDLDRFNGHAYVVQDSLPTMGLVGLTLLTASLWMLTWTCIGLWSLRR